jgi:hypothetical protein
MAGENVSKDSGEEANGEEAMGNLSLKDGFFS